jgi:hypothetical protein
LSRVEHAGKKSITTDTGRTVEEEARAVLISPWNAVLSKICARAVRSSCTSHADTRAAGVACSICTLICTLPKGSYGPLAPGCRVQRHAANWSSTDFGCMWPSDWYKRQYGPKVSGTRQKRSSDQLRSIRFDFAWLSRVFFKGPKSQYTTSLYRKSLAVLQKFTACARQLCILTAHTWPRNTGRLQRHCDSTPPAAGTQQTRMQ